MRPAPVRFLNLGGGFGIPYFPGEQRSTWRPSAQPGRWSRAQGATCRRRGIVIELGRYLVGEAGVYVTRIVDRKVSRGQVFLVTDGGLNHHLSASGNFGQVVRKNYPVTSATAWAPARGGVGRRPAVHAAGPAGRPHGAAAAAQMGDLVVVYQSGAYGASASPQAFLGHP
jgi:diaminopimelate decarboxylase